jgi:hypothetical protein
MRHYADRRKAVMINLEAVVAEYIDTVLWSESCRGSAPDEVCDHYGKTGDERVDCDKSLEYLNYDASDLAAESLVEITADVTDFVQANTDDIEALMTEGKADEASIGHNLLLTRNRHGAGFWDCGWGERGDRLTDAAHVYGETSAYVGDDGKIYVS